MNGLPYMGSKRKIASSIVSAVVSRHPNVVNFYDVFGGGGSISLEALKYKYLNVHYNELNTAQKILTEADKIMAAAKKEKLHARPSV